MADIERLLSIMARLRDPDGGCPWDLEQRFETIAPYTIEEAYEVDDAIRRRDLDALCDELGDLLFQVVYHARLAEESGAFAFAEVVERVCEKMVRRHPHVFGDARVDGAGAQVHAWEGFKEGERAGRAAREGRPASALDDVPLGLPALLRAAKLLRRERRTGLSDPKAEATAEALAPSAGTLDERSAGDRLLALARRVAQAGIEPETALREALARYESRLRAREEGVSEEGVRPGRDRT
ncbi:MAG: nucleoside triphosphate pyrophosphohydrolase [Proteobacteria bacterium]|nr:nucleoside triphosphate pyrophosphohydrolase [Pseudomonadota bacterium]